MVCFPWNYLLSCKSEFQKSEQEFLTPIHIGSVYILHLVCYCSVQFFVFTLVLTQSFWASCKWEVALSIIVYCSGNSLDQWFITTKIISVEWKWVFFETIFTTTCLDDFQLNWGKSKIQILLNLSALQKWLSWYKVEN